jgi:predicted transcriptional regulator
MLRDDQIAILLEISQSVGFADDRHGEVEHLIVEGYVMKDGDLYELTAKGLKAVEDHAAALGPI